MYEPTTAKHTITLTDAELWILWPILTEGYADEDGIQGWSARDRRVQMTRRRKTDQQLMEAIAKIDSGRVQRGECRHCGGRVPCYSELGDAAIGKRHTPKTFRFARAGALKFLSAQGDV